MALVTIVCIVLIIVVAGGIIAFIWNIILGAFDNERKETKQEVVTYNQVKQLENSNEQSKEYDFESINEAKAEQEKSEAEAEQEKSEAEATNEDFDADLQAIEDRLKEADEAEAETEVKPENSEDADLDDADLEELLSGISDEVVEEEKEKANENNEVKMSDELESYSIDDLINQIDEEETDNGEEAAEQTEETEATEETETTEETEQTEATEETVEEAEETEPETTEEVETEEVAETDEVAADNTELKEANETIEQLRAQLQSLNQQLEEVKKGNREEVAIDMTEEQCLARLATLEERRKKLMVEYKANLKEYRPLKKIVNDLERYQTKLRKKDAIVAKKKVALYGVNNYVDIDKEKAEKLANELELLDGLRLSVSHCEEVINANKDRYPILEHTNNILEEQIANIEADIENTNKVLEKIREREGKGNK